MGGHEKISMYPCFGKPEIIMYTSKLNADYIPRYFYNHVFANNWASEASPTLGCSIEISRDICIYVGVCMYK